MRVNKRVVAVTVPILALAAGVLVLVLPPSTDTPATAAAPTPTATMSATTSTTPPTTTPPASPTAAATTTSRPPTTPTAPRTTTRPPAPPAPPNTSETTMRAFVTGYSWFDNTPPGSADIAFPGLHKKAGGTGTYADPITVAVGHTITNRVDTPDWPAGTRFYIPNLRRYFIVEDSCGDGSTPQNGPCHTGYPSTATTWLDVWVGGQRGDNSGADACMNSITAVWTVIKAPASTYAVVAGDIYGPPCTTQYGNTAVRA